MATATIVTRISSDEKRLAGQISNQMGLSKAWVPFGIIIIWSCSWYAKHFIFSWHLYRIIAYTHQRIQMKLNKETMEEEKEENHENRYRRGIR